MRASLCVLALAACGGGTSNHTLSVTAAGPGSVTSQPSGIACRAATCPGGFAANSSVTLTAHPDAAASFSGWSGACTGSSPTCTVSLAADAQATATFVGAGAGAHTLTIAVDGSGNVTSTPPGISCPTQCSAAFADGTQVTLTANAQGGASFSGWSGACAGTSCQITVSADASASASFSVPANSHKLTVSISGQGSVKSTPAGIDCPATSCASFFADGTSVALSASPGQGQVFNGWTGGCSGAGGCTVSITADATVTANFGGPGY